MLNNIYGINIYFLFPIIFSVSKYKNKEVISVPKHDANPRKLLFRPKKSIVNDWLKI